MPDSIPGPPHPAPLLQAGQGSTRICLSYPACSNNQIQIYTVATMGHRVMHNTWPTVIAYLL